jgi:peptide/nickel transport system substrate-binding protein
MFNTVNLPRDHPLVDKRVRQALNYAIDRKTLIDAVMRGVGSPFGTFCVEFSFGCDASIQPFTYDPERARTLLREAGYAGGFDLTLSTSNGGYPGDMDLTLAVADQLSRVGVRPRVVVGELSTLLTQARERKLPYNAWFNRITDAIGYAGRAAVTLFHSSRGAVAMWVPGDKDFEDLLDTAEVTLDEAKAKDLYRRAQLLFKDEAPAIVLITAPNAYGMSRKLNWQPRPDLWLTMFDASLNP